MQAARHLVTAAAKLTDCVKNRKYNRYGRQACLAVDAYRNTTAVIGNSDDIALLD